MPNPFRLTHDGAERFDAVLDDGAVAALCASLSPYVARRPGARLTDVAGLAALLAGAGAVGAIVHRLLGDDARAVRAVLFEKNADTNWKLGWHQDRTILVRERIEVDGFGPWTLKQGLLHVAPPPEVQREMITVRVHLDDVDADNAPLLIAPGSHRLGRIAEPDVPDVVARCGAYSCLAQAGDMWVYATPILHASEAAARPRRRRVLQVDYAARDLPGGLQWLGV
ncbi:MAG: hypothetical protein JWM77_415 [Rhodospirillales bacterium]|nr:hypothetical protein [Rhodospirillales bacterium]